MRKSQVIAFVVVSLVGGIAVAGLSLRKEAPRRVKLDESAVARRVLPGELAQWIIEGRRDFTVIDLRKTEAFEAAHVRDAVHCGSCHENKAEGRKAAQEHFIDLSKKLVLYTDTGKETVELPKIIARNPHLHVLDGGWAGWQKEVLAPVTFGGETDPAQIEDKRKREAIRAFFAGERPQTAAPAQLPITPIRRENAHKPAGASEGC